MWFEFVFLFESGNNDSWKINFYKIVVKLKEIVFIKVFRKL